MSMDKINVQLQSLYNIQQKIWVKQILLENALKLNFQAL